MSPKTGRPLVGDLPKDRRIALRATAETQRKLQECAVATGKTQTDLLEEMVNRLYKETVNKK
mgnify:CR=1 FL=1|nr:MAG TPA: NikA, BACTERIAL CONJUGATION, RELAXASE, DNA [Bacteriophage sp.]